MADIAANARRDKNAAAISPIALEAVRRIDALFDSECGSNGQSAEERPRARKEQSAPLLTALEAWPREQRTRLSNSSSVAKPIDYMLRRWDRFAHFIEDGRICLTASISFLISLDLALSMASHPVRKKTIRKSGSIPRIAGKHRDC